MQVDKLRKGSEHIKASSGVGGKFTPTIFWKEDGEEKILAFITPIEDMFTLNTHTIKLAQGWRTFVCRKNEAFEDESEGKCELCDEYENKVAKKHFALAAELEPVVERVSGRKQISDLSVKMIEGKEDKLYPRIGVVMQSAGNFYDYLKTYDAQRADITTLSFEIVRSGKGTNTGYQFFPVDMRPDLAEYEEDFPSLVDYIADLGSEERYDNELNNGGKKPSSESEEEPTPVKASKAKKKSEEESSDDFEALRARLERGR